jgi:formate/nitrite transporter FocA (FNT family)
MTYTQRAISVGGYFTIGMLVINLLFAGVTPMYAAVMSLIFGCMFTTGALFAGWYKPRRRY